MLACSTSAPPPEEGGEAEGPERDDGTRNIVAAAVVLDNVGAPWSFKLSWSDVAEEEESDEGDEEGSADTDAAIKSDEAVKGEGTTLATARLIWDWRKGVREGKNEHKDGRSHRRTVILRG